MRLVTWNCNMALHRKWAALTALKPDIAIVQECASPEICLPRLPGSTEDRFLWTGKNSNKGLGVVSFGDWRLERHSISMEGADYFLPVHVTGPASFSLLAVWATYRSADKVKASTGPTHRALDRLADFLSSGDVLVAGDFNNNVRWDKPGWGYNHSGAVDRLEKLGLKSAYHSFHGISQGEESEPTLYWRNRTADRPRYHIDHVFIPAHVPVGAFNVSVGRHADWILPKLSDHVPVVLDVEDGALFNGALAGLEAVA